MAVYSEVNILELEQWVCTAVTHGSCARHIFNDAVMRVAVSLQSSMDSTVTG